MNSTIIVNTIKKYRNNFIEYGISKIGLFGSYINDSNNEESDIDILIKFEEGKKNFDNYISIKFLLEDIFNKKVDLVDEDCIREELKYSILGSVMYV